MSIDPDLGARIKAAYEAYFSGEKKDHGTATVELIGHHEILEAFVVRADIKPNSFFVKPDFFSDDAEVGDKFAVEFWTQDYGSGNVRKEWIATSLTTGSRVQMSTPLGPFDHLSEAQP